MCSGRRGYGGLPPRVPARSLKVYNVVAFSVKGPTFDPDGLISIKARSFKQLPANVFLRVSESLKPVQRNRLWTETKKKPPGRPRGRRDRHTRQEGTQARRGQVNGNAGTDPEKRPPTLGQNRRLRNAPFSRAYQPAVTLRGPARPR